MRLNINLATQKYEDAGEFYLRWGGALAAVVLLTVALVILTWKNHSGSIQVTQRIASLHHQIDEVEKQRARNQAVRNRPENRTAVEQSDFWNSVIDQRQLSWTQLFSDLERIMPGRAFVISVAPSVTPDKRLKLELTIGGENHENAVELVKKMEGSDRFRFPVLKEEHVRTMQQGKASVVEFRIETYYTPASLLPQAHGEGKAGMP
jgi:hypothetical protein